MPTGIGPNEFILDEDGKDLQRPAKKKLGDYLAKRTLAGEETFTPPIQGNGEYTYLPPRPNRTPVTNEIHVDNADAQQKSAGSYAKDEEMTTHLGNQELRNAVKVVPSSERETNGGTYGNELLQSEKTRDIVKSAVLSSNRFTSANKFSLGTHKSSQPLSPASVDGANVSGEDVYTIMRRSALVSMINAAGGSSGPGGGQISINDMNNSGEVDIKNSLPRIGIFPNVFDSDKVKVENLSPGSNRSRYTTDSNSDLNEVFTDDLRGFESDIPGASPAKYNVQTYGQLNSYLKNFSGTGTLSEVAIALLAYAALFIAVSVVSLIVSLIVGKLPRPNPETETLPLGSERGTTFGKFLFGGDDESSLRGALANVGHLISKLLGVMQPYDGPFLVSYFLSALVGVLSIVGIDTSKFVNADSAASVLAAVASSAVNIAINFSMSPGYYLTIVREVARDLALFTNSSVSESSIIGVIAGIRELKLLRFVDTCARLGIVAQYAKYANTDSDPDQPLEPGKIIPGAPANAPAGLETNLLSTAQSRVSKTRDTTASNRLAWSHISLGYTRTELVTEDLLRSFAIYPHFVGGAKVTGAGALRSLRAKKVASSNGRIDPETRKYHETLLDAEYMPFYFHDIRTNEILSFHAFLSSLSDSFSANYNSVEGFGRMDPIQIYKNTTRAISFTFNVVSTSPEDHENMWYSINKLVNMVYPQWSAGDEITDGSNNKFTQPFSQTIAASPLLRVRIGDVISSNYSRFGLSRIFGLDKTGAKINGVDLNAEEKFNPDGQPKAIFDATNNSPAKKDITQLLTLKTGADLNSPANLNVNVQNEEVAVAAGNAQVRIFKPRVKIRPGRYKLYELFNDAYNATNGNSEKIKSDLLCTIVRYKTTNWSKDPLADIVVEFDNPIELSSRFGASKNMKYAIVKAGDVTSIDDSWIDYPGATDLPKAAPGASSAETTVSNFLDPKKNAIVKSFEDGSGGRGLAGFITSLGVDYGSTDMTWNVERGSRAPNMAIISVTFSPIHDIPMGLGADGTARSVAYPVGDITRRRFMSDIVSEDNNNPTLSQPLKNKQA